MLIHDFSSYSRETLVDTLRILKSYKSTLRQQGHRAVLQDTHVSEVLIPKIEYAPGIDTDILMDYAQKACRKYFPEYSGSLEKSFFHENAKLVSGMRIHYGDDLVDVSFQKFTHVFHS